MNEVIMCHGSNYIKVPCQHFAKNGRVELTKMSDATIYNPSVAKSEMTIFRNIEFVKISLSVIGLSPLFSIFWIPLTARKNAAN
jgi:hypothetical protein